MLNTQKLLYILPDLAYVVELLPAKKANSFSVQSFRQINGEFIDENDFVSRNILKLFSKLDPEEYHLILPDYLFTNTIVSIDEKSDAKIKQHLKDKLLPQLELSQETHSLETFVLNEFKSNSRVQLSAIEKSMLAPIRVGAYINKVKITAISPISWAVKSVISLEPSISVLQVGTKLYCAQHYIGVDQTTFAEVNDVEAIAETIKTLKGAEPSIQTIYLLTNDLVEQKLKDLLSNTIPLQQLTPIKDDDSQMPSYVRQIIESSMRTLSLSDYPVPNFELAQPTEDEIETLTFAPETNTKTSQGLENIEPKSTKTTNDQKNDEKVMTEEEEGEREKEKDEEKEEESDEIETAEPTIEPLVETISQQEDLIEDEINKSIDDETQKKLDAEIIPEPIVPPTLNTSADLSITTTEDSPIKESSMKKEVTTSETAQSTSSAVIQGGLLADQQTVKTAEPSVDISKFAQHKEETAEPKVILPIHDKMLIKNKSGVGNMLKYVFITLAAFFATIAIGVGIGLGVLRINSNRVMESPTVIVEDEGESIVESEPEPTPEPSPEPEFDLAELSVLVVNATPRAGYAGTIKSNLEKAGFGTVVAGNAKGDYEEGNYLLINDESFSALLEEIATATDLEFSIQEDSSVEDPSSNYDFVVVLAN